MDEKEYLVRVLDWFEMGRIHGYGLTVERGDLFWIHLSDRPCHELKCEMSHCYCSSCSRQVDVYRMHKYE